MSAFVLCVAGRMGSGKSSLSQAVADRLGWPRGSFGDYVRSIADKRGLPEDRETLQDIGAQLVAEDPEGFCRAVLTRAGWSSDRNLVLDGVRHLEVLGALRTLVQPGSIALVFVDVADDERRKRLGEQLEEIDFRLADRHPTEAQAERLREAADLVVAGDNLDTSEAHVLRFVADLMPDTPE